MSDGCIKIVTYDIWIAKCDNCATNYLKTEKPKGPRTCNCGKIVEYKQTTWTGPEIKK